MIGSQRILEICFLSSMHPPRDKRVFDKEAVSLANAGFKVCHLCPGNASDSGVSKGVEIITYRKPSGILGRIKQLSYLFSSASRIDADVYHCNEVDSWFVGVLLTIFRGKKCVFDVHEHYPSTFAESRFPKYLQPVVSSGVRVFFQILLPFTEALVLAKKSVGADFRCKDSKKLLIRNFSPKNSRASEHRKRGRNPDDEMTLVHLGLFNKIRGWPQILDAISMTEKRVKLQVIGEINDGSEDEFMARLKSLDLEDRVQILQWMPFDQAFEHLLRADVGLIAFQPNIQNHIFAMPHKLFDYMSAGLTVLLPKEAEEVAPIVEKHKCGLLIDSSSPEDIAKRINFLFENPKVSQEMGERGSKAVQDKYNWESEVQELIRFYRQLDC